MNVLLLSTVSKVNVCLPDAREQFVTIPDSSIGLPEV